MEYAPAAALGGLTIKCKFGHQVLQVIIYESRGMHVILSLNNFFTIQCKVRRKVLQAAPIQRRPVSVRAATHCQQHARVAVGSLQRSNCCLHCAAWRAELQARASKAQRAFAVGAVRLGK